MTKIVYIITRNKGKILAAQNVFSKFGIEVKNIEKDYPEIQADTSLEIAKYTAEEACKDFNVPVIREDHSLFINGMGGFPGPYANYFDKKIPAEKILTLMEDEQDREGYFEVAAAYAKPNSETKTFVFRVPIKVSTKIQGNQRNWDKILGLANKNKTFAETPEGENVEVWNKNYLEIAKLISEEN